MEAPTRVYRAEHRLLEELNTFYRKAGIRMEEGWDCLILLRDENEVLAAGCRAKQVLKCLAVRGDAEGGGLAAVIVSELIKEAAEKGITHLFLYTKPKNRPLFSSLGFHPVQETEQVCMLENRRGLERFLSALPRLEGEKTGCIVAHASPFTLGHLALVETAARECDGVYLFLLAEETEPFTPQQRLTMAEKAVAHLPNVRVLSGGAYLVSLATFPDYFYPDQVQGRRANCMLDLRLFGERIAPALHITARYVGEEPFSPVTEEYNRAMIELLPKYGLTVRVMPRFSVGGEVVSAGKVRRALANGDFDAVRAMTPQINHRFLRAFMAGEK